MLISMFSTIHKQQVYNNNLHYNLIQLPFSWCFPASLVTDNPTSNQIGDQIANQRWLYFILR